MLNEKEEFSIKVEYVVNNYTLGARIKMTPTECITSQDRLDRYRTKIVYSLSGDKQKQFIDKCLSKNGKILPDTLL